MNEFDTLYEKLYGNPTIAEFIINTSRLFEIVTSDNGVLLYNGKYKLLTYINCKGFESKTVPVLEPITDNVVAFVSKMFRQVFRLPKNMNVKVVVKKDVIEFKLPDDDTFSLVDVYGHLLLK